MVEAGWGGLGILSLVRMDVVTAVSIVLPCFMVDASWYIRSPYQVLKNRYIALVRTLK